jgi:hypothetical protein
MTYERNEAEAHAVRVDAQQRAARTLVQGLLFDVLAALILVVFTAVSKANAWGDLEWTVLAFSVAKTTVVSALSYLMRTVFASRFPVE